MRTTILPSMLEIVARNLSYRNKSARLYELGKIYLPREDGLADEPKYLSLGAYGDGADFFSFKGSIETLLHELRITDVKYRCLHGQRLLSPRPLRLRLRGRYAPRRVRPDPPARCGELRRGYRDLRCGAEL